MINSFDVFTVQELEELFPGDKKTQRLVAIFSGYQRAVDICLVCWSPVSPEEVIGGNARCGVCGSGKTLLSRLPEEKVILILNRIFKSRKESSWTGPKYFGE